jgi:hypothetical protein
MRDVSKRALIKEGGEAETAKEFFLNKFNTT